MSNLKITKENLYWFGVMMYIALINIADAIPGGTILHFATLLLVVISQIMKGHGKLRVYFSGLHLFVICFTLFCFSSMLWADYPQYTVSKAIGVLVNACVVSIISLGAEELNDIEKLLKVAMYGFYLAVIAAIVFFGPSQLISIMKNSDRISGDSSIDRNSIGMTAAYAIVINAYILIYKKNLHFTDLLSVPALFLIIATGSRKALLIVVGGIMAIFLLKNWSNRSKILSALKILAVMALIVLLLIPISQLPIFSNMMDRMNDIITALNGTNYVRGNTAWLRLEYISLGMSLFRENPILGIGIGNANVYTQATYGHFHYLHNNYVELLACGGLTGAVIYYSIYAYILWTFWKCRKYRNEQYDICLIILLVRLVMDYGLVSFYGKLSYIFLILFWFKAMQLKAQYRQDQEGGRRVGDRHAEGRLS